MITPLMISVEPSSTLIIINQSTSPRLDISHDTSNSNATTNLSAITEIDARHNCQAGSLPRETNYA